MANNPYNNKVQLSDGTVLMDLTEDTVTPQTMVRGTTAHDRSGAPITGEVDLADAGTSTPLPDDNTGVVGISNKYAREDHVHPVSNILLSERAARQKNGATNLLPYPYLRSSYYEYGITYTVNDDGSITINGTATNATGFILSLKDFGSTSFNSKNVSTAVYKAYLFNAPAALSLTYYQSTKNTLIEIPNGTSINNVTVYPMICLAEDNVTEYRKYAMTNNELTNTLNILPANRLKGKKIAIYADSWGNPNYGSLGKDYLEDLTGETVHLSWLGSQTMAQIYTNCWDSYNADIYIINGGLNDFGQNVTITEFKTAISNFVTAMRTINSNCEIYFITPEFIRTSTQQTQRYPLEAYRAAIWGLKNLYKYNVVNSLKWVNVSYQSDNVHPLATDADLIGSYIASALINYGDEETHITEFTTLGNLKSNQLILYMIGGSPYLYFQQFSATANSTDRYPVDITAFYEDIGFFQLTAMNGKTGDPAIVFHIITDPNYITVYSKGVGTGNEIYVNGLLVPTYFRPLTMPNSF